MKNQRETKKTHLLSEGRREQREAITLHPTFVVISPLSGAFFPRLNIWFVEYSMSRLAFLYSESPRSHIHTFNTHTRGLHKFTTWCLFACLYVGVCACVFFSGVLEKVETGRMFNMLSLTLHIVLSSSTHIKKHADSEL